MKEQYRIAAKRSLTPEIGQISVEAPLIAARAKAGQFIILRVDEAGERIPLTISSAQDGKVTVVYQKVGGTTLALDQLQEGDCLHDFVGPLGTPTHVEGYRRVAVLGGGLGCAIALPVANAMKEAGARGPDRRLPLQGHRDPGGGDGTGGHRLVHMRGRRQLRLPRLCHRQTGVTDPGRGPV